ncbi:MAG: dienelactone hydrolase family protein [Chloroflexota bacterium]
MLENTHAMGQREVRIAAGSATLEGTLGWSDTPRGVVLFAHGSGSGRFSPRNNYVAAELQRGGLATLLIDLLTEAESGDRRLVFDIDLLADRLLAARAWLRGEALTQPLPIGYFGASTGAGAALQAAAREPAGIDAIVSRGGRPDLAGPYLEVVRAPTLLIVGGADDVVIDLNREAMNSMRASTDLVIIPGATHLFEESGALEEVARLANAWFIRFLVAPSITHRPEIRP